MIVLQRPKFLFYFLGVSAVVALISAPALAVSSISNITVTQMELDSGASGQTITGFLGGDVLIGLGADIDNERRLALDSIPFVFDWAYWDPGSLGDDFQSTDPNWVPNGADPIYWDPNDFPGVDPVNNVEGYHSGRQIQWGSKFSTDGTGCVDKDGVGTLAGDCPANGLLFPSMDTQGAAFNLDSGDYVVAGGNSRMRVSESGRIGLDMNVGADPSGEHFVLEMTLQPGVTSSVSLFAEDNNEDTPNAALMTLEFPGVGVVNVPSLGAGDDEFILQFDVFNDSASPEVLTFKFGDINDTLGDLDIKFDAAVIQIIPEPGSLALAGLGALGLLARRRRRI